MFRWLRNRLPLSLLILFFLVVFVTNFPFDTWFTGWDNLHPEYDFLLNIRRAFSGVWQGNQGLGHLGGHGYSASIFHTVLLWILSWVLPQIHLRSAFTFLMLIAGSLGAYALARYLLRKISGYAQWGGLTAGMFYMLHLGTVEQFYFQFEPFVIFYAMLPWAVLTGLQYLNSQKRADLYRLILVNALMSSIGFIPPLFVVYFISLTVILLSYVLSEKQKRKRRKRGWISVTILAVMIGVNAFWLLPVAYYTLQGSDVYLRSQNNELSTQDFALRGKSYGDILDVVLGRGFVFDALDSPVTPGEDVFHAMQPWHDHLSRLGITELGVVLFSVALIGCVWGLYKKRSWEIVGMAGVLAFGIAALGQNIPGLFAVSDLLQSIPVLGQAFRAAFTKVSVPYILSLSVFFGFGTVILTRALERVMGEIRMSIIPLFLILLIVIYSFPVLGGQLLYRRLKITPPAEYQELFSYLRTDRGSEERIAHFPVPWNWGWSVYEWGYSGSGFLWYGVEQPILDRAFDVWSQENEGFYHEVVTAVNGESSDDLVRIFRKYDVRLLLIDKSVVLPGFGDEHLKFDFLAKHIGDFGYMRVFESGSLELYELGESADFVSVNAPEYVDGVSGYTPYIRYDPVYELLGDYYLTDDGYVFPFIQLLSNREVEVDYSGDTVVLSSDVPTGSYTIKNTSLNKGEYVVGKVSVERLDRGLRVIIEPIVPEIDGSLVSTVFPYTYDHEGLIVFSGFVQVGEQAFPFNFTGEGSVLTLGNANLRFGESFPVALYGEDDLRQLSVLPELYDQGVQSCWKQEGVLSSVVKENIEGGVRMGAENASACLVYRLGDLGSPSLVSTKVSYRTTGDMKPHFCITKEDSGYSCFNPDVYSSYPSSGVYTDIQQITGLDSSGVYWFDLIARGVGSSSGYVEYREFDLRVGSPGAYVVVGDDYWSSLKNLYDEQDVIVSDGFSVEVLSGPVRFDAFADLRSVDNCSVFENGEVDLEWRLQGLSFIASDNGVACRSVVFPQLSTDIGYLMRIAGEHEVGRGFKFYVRNGYTNAQDIEKLFPAGDFDVSVGLMPWVGEGPYTVSLENRSFPGTETENWLRVMDFYPIPYKWLSELYLEPVGVSELDNSFSVSSVSSYGTWMYRVEGEIAGEQGLVALSQGYDDGWIAWIRGGSHRFLEHVRVNGWKNGWIVDDTEGQEIVIMMVYLPQLLQWVGFGILGGFVVWLVRGKK